MPGDDGVAGPGGMQEGEAGVAWAGLLANATQLVTAASVVPPEHDGVAWRASMPAIIGLQSVTMALGWMVEKQDSLGAADLRVGLDRARVLTRQFEREIEAAWRGRTLPAAIGELVSDGVVAASEVEALLKGRVAE